LLPTITRKNISEQVAGHLRDYIISHSLQPGDRLPTEAELADQFGVSRSSIREAVKVLESTGVVQSRPRHGIRVKRVSTRHLTDQLRFLLALDGVSLREMGAARLAIEKASIPMIAQNADEEDFRRMSAAIARGRELTDRGEVYSDADLEFHLALGRATKNRVMQGLAGMLQEFFAAVAVQVSPDKEKQHKSLDEHQQIYEALRARNAVAAQNMLDIHLSVYSHFQATEALDDA